MDNICSEKQTVFRECSSRKTVSFKEQIMSMVKYLSVILRQTEAIVFVVLQIYFAVHMRFLKLGNITRYSAVFSHVTHVDQYNARYTGTCLLFIKR